jgi:hypothetical protein
MIRRMRSIGLCSVVVLAMGAIAAAGAIAASPNYQWVEKGSSILTNTAIKLATKTGSKFSLHATLLGANATVECKTIATSNSVIFDVKSRLNKFVGQGKGEVQFTECKTNICEKVKEPIKWVPVGNGESTLVADAKEASEVTKVYNDFLPNSGKGFIEITLENGICGGTPVKFTVSTPLMRGGLVEAKEGEAGLLAELDKSSVSVEKESIMHELTFSCTGTSQMPTSAFNADAEEIKLDELRLEGKSACLEGVALMTLSSGKEFSAK